MTYHYRQDLDHGREIARRTLHGVLAVLATEGLRPPGETGDTWARWRSDDDRTHVIVRADTAGGVSLDVNAAEGRGLFAPKDYTHYGWLARDIGRVLADVDAVITLGAAYVSEEHHQARVATKRAWYAGGER